MTARRSFRAKVLWMFAAMVSTIFTLVPSVLAQQPGDSPVQVSIAGHLDLPGMVIEQMYLRQRGDKSYLFLHRADKNAFAIVDVTNPSKPVLVERRALAEPAGGNVALPAPGSRLAIAVEPTKASGSSGSGVSASAATPPTQSVRLVDTSDLRHPKTIKTFEGVTTMATDDGRKLVFLVNGEGLWIVSHHRDRPLPMCTTEDAEKAEPACQ